MYGRWYLKESSDTIPKEAQELNELKLAVTGIQIELKGAGKNKNSFSAFGRHTPELISKVKERRKQFSKKVIQGINQFEAELEIWTPENIIKLCRYYIKDVIRRYKKYHVQNFTLSAADKNKLHEKNLEEFLFSLIAFPRVLKDEFIAPVLRDIIKYLRDIAGMDAFLYDTIDALLDNFVLEFEKLDEKARDEIAGIGNLDMDAKMNDETWEVDNYHPDNFPVWNNLLNEYQKDFDEYLINKSTTYSDTRIISSDLLNKIRESFKLEALLQGIFDDIDLIVAGKEVEDLYTEVSVNYTKRLSHHLQEDLAEVEPAEAEGDLQTALAALALAGFTKEEIDSYQKTLSNHPYLQCALSAAYYYLTKEKTGFFHGAHGEKATRCYIRNLMKLADLSVQSIQHETLQYLSGEGLEYGRRYWDAGSGHHKRSRIRYFLGLFEDKENEIRNQCKQTPDVLRFFNARVKFEELSAKARKEITVGVKRLRV